MLERVTARGRNNFSTLPTAFCSVLLFHTRIINLKVEGHTLFFMTCLCLSEAKGMIKNMIIVRIQGGIGNQLFQYAFYKELEARGKQVYADLSKFDSKGEYRQYELPKLSLEVNQATQEMLAQYKINNPFIKRLYSTGLFSKQVIIDKKSQTYSDEFWKYDDVYMIGYWQSAKYFPSVANSIRNSVKFINIDTKNQLMIKKMKNVNSVSVHVRLGDYVGCKMYENICTPRYYKNAIDYIKKLQPEVKFFVFADEIEKAREYFYNEEVEFVELNSGENSYLDMLLISSCKHHIMANSSFSWWGVFLSEFKEGIVLTPSKWLNGVETPDIWCEEWIKI